MNHSARAFVIAYDIADPKRLQQVHKFLKKHAVAVQYSVFVGVYRPYEIEEIVNGLSTLIDHRRDDCRLYPLPERCRPVILGAHSLADGIALRHRGIEIFRTMTGCTPDEFEHRLRDINETATGSTGN